MMPDKRTSDKHLLSLYPSGTKQKSYAEEEQYFNKYPYITHCKDGLKPS
jgi:hypothetical protein